MRRFLAEECSRVDGVDRQPDDRPAGRGHRSRCTSSARRPTWTRILELAAEYGLAVIEDASEALGSLVQGQDVRRPRADRLPQLQRQQDRHQRRRRRDPDRRRRARRRGALPHHAGQGRRHRVHPPRRRLQLPHEQRAGRARSGAAGDHRRAPRRRSARTSPCTSRPWARSAAGCSSSRRGATPTAGSTPTCATTPRRRTSCCAPALAADIQVRPLWYPNHLQTPYADMQAYEVERALWFYDRLVNLPCSVTLTARRDRPGRRGHRGGSRTALIRRRRTSSRATVRFYPIALPVAGLAADCSHGSPAAIDHEIVSGHVR